MTGWDCREPLGPAVHLTPTASINLPNQNYLNPARFPLLAVSFPEPAGKSHQFKCNWHNSGQSEYSVSQFLTVILMEFGNENSGPTKGSVLRVNLPGKVEMNK